MGSLQFDDDAEENTEDLRFSRVSSSEAFSESVPGLQWLCYPEELPSAGFDNDEGRECDWHKITAAPDSLASARDDAEAIPSLEHVYQDLVSWQADTHPLLLRIQQVWHSDTCIDVVSDATGVNNLQQYLAIHQHVGEPAIRKLSRQLLKAFIALERRSSLPIHKISICDVHVRAGNARVCIMPTFLWRPEPEGHLPGASVTQLEVLRAWANVVIEMYTRDASVSRLPLACVQDRLRGDMLPPDAVQLLSTCLDEDASAELPLGEMLDHPWLNTRTFAAQAARVRTASDARAGQIVRFSSMVSARPSSSATMNELLNPAPDDENVPISTGCLKGIEYDIAVTGRPDDIRQEIAFTVRLQRLPSVPAAPAEDEDTQVLTFPYDLVHDTVDKVIGEMQEQQIQLTATDLELVASAMREVIAHHAPGLETISSIGASLPHLRSTMLQ